MVSVYTNPMSCRLMMATLSWMEIRTEDLPEPGSNTRLAACVFVKENPGNEQLDGWFNHDCVPSFNHTDSENNFTYDQHERRFYLSRT